MSKSPGHQQMPHHKVDEKHLHDKFKVKLNDMVIAESDDVIEVDEDGSPVRFYFPRSDVKMDLLQRTDTMTKCPFKGTANYYSIGIGNKIYDDSVWTYEQPYDEHADLKDRLAFYDDKTKEIKIEREAA